MSKAGTIRLGDLHVNRLGFGAMQIPGPGVWGPPARPPDSPDGAIALLRRVVELGVNFIDTADAYGPDVSEELIAQALAPYDGVVVATKAGLTRSGPGAWSPDGRTIFIDLHFMKGVIGFLASYNLDTRKHTWYHYEQNESEIHFNLSPDGKTFVGDGSPRPGNQGIFLLHPVAIPDDQTLGTDLIAAGVLKPEKLCVLSKTAIHGDHNYRLEPNVSFTPDQKYVIFRSNIFGPDYAFAVEVAKAAAP